MLPGSVSLHLILLSLLKWQLDDVAEQDKAGHCDNKRSGSRLCYRESLLRSCLCCSGFWCVLTSLLALSLCDSMSPSLSIQFIPGSCQIGTEVLLTCKCRLRLNHSRLQLCGFFFGVCVAGPLMCEVLSSSFGSMLHLIESVLVL